MNLLENISLAMAGLRAGKMRALLTMLGIIIGIGSVITIATIGDALTGSLTSSMASLGVNNIMVSLQERGTQADDGPGRGGPPGGGSSSAVAEESDQITMEMIEGLTPSSNTRHTITLKSAGIQSLAVKGNQVFPVA